MSMVHVTIEPGTTELLARVLEEGKPPYYFVPSGKYRGIAMSTRRMLLVALIDTYGIHNIMLTPEAQFNAMVEAKGGSN